MTCASFVSTTRNTSGRPTNPSTASISESVYVCYISLSAIGNDTRANDVSPPLGLRLAHSSGNLCGCTSHLHSFHQQACFETAFVLITKSGFFKPSDILMLHECQPLLSHLICMCIHLRHHNLLSLAKYDTAWATQDTLSDNKAYSFLACLLHYNLSIAHTIQLLGNNYTGKYCNIPSIVASI